MSETRSRFQYACVVRLKTTRSFTKARKIYLHPLHKPDALPSTHLRVTAMECAEKSLDDETNPYTRKLQLLTDDELKQFALQRIANIVTRVNFLLQGTSDINRVCQKLVELKNELCLLYPERNS